MLNEQEVQEIFARAWEEIKPRWDTKEGFMKSDRKGMLPELWPGYNRSVSDKLDLMPHIEQGWFADRLIKDRSPNQTPQEFEYIKANAKQVTLPVFVDFENTIRRAFHESNWSLEFAEGQEGLQEYISTGLADYTSLFNFMRFVLPKIKTLDPMGLLTVLPSALETYVDEEGTERIAPDTEVSPIPGYVPVEKVWAWERGRYYMWLSEENSEVEYSGKTVKKGLVVVLVDDTAVWKIT
ncbi:MAG TPA: hypothetical protein PLF80_15415, partial [Flavobacteriales bacterium]|nr:hypothetical protein [Flavobacteriales bacterium]